MGRYGMAGDHYRQSGYVTLQDVPDPNREYVESFANLTGGMNRFDLDYRLKGNESPFMQNLSWHNGTLTSRLGQVEKYHTYLSSLGAYSVAQFLFHGWLLHQNSEGIGWVKIQEMGYDNESALGTTNHESFDDDDAPWNTSPGVFFRYREEVFFKTKGFYIRIYWSKSDDTIHATNAMIGAFVPTIQKDTNPTSGAGLEYQRENRLTYNKKVEFNGDGITTVYQLPISAVGFDPLFTSAVVDIDPDHETYYLVDMDATAGTVTFNIAPPTGQNNVAVTYSKENPEALGSLLDSSAAIVFGGAQELCVVMGGPDAQPNSYFWSGNNGLVMDPTYFPMNQYNLAGDNDDPITCFGKQQNMLVIFQPHATGRAVFGTVELDNADGGEKTVQITMNYTRINAEIGCDLPGSLQLVENNLVWCNRKYGVCRLKDSSAAYENNIVQISRKVNGDYRLDGLLEQLKSVADDAVRSTDTGKRYILVLGDEDGKAYEWNYELSEYSNPSWFYHTGILGVGFVPLANEELYEVTEDGKVATFEPVFKDFGTTAIEKIYRFPPRDFGSYDRLKNIKSILVTTRSDSKTNTALRYICDYTERNDPTNLVVTPNERNFAVIFRRKPGYHNIHHLGIELSNNTAGDDLNIVSAQIFYEYRGRVR